MKCLILEHDKKTGRVRAVATRINWARATDEVWDIRQNRTPQMNRRYSHEIKLIKETTR